MKILSAAQIHEWDQYTIQHEPISSIDLMERAANACVDAILSVAAPKSAVWVLCGPGNNGGDGLAITRLLHKAGRLVHCFAASQDPLSAVNKTNRERLVSAGISVRDLGVMDLGNMGSDDIVIDAIFGIGQSRPVSGDYARLAGDINASGAFTIAIDIPTGLYADGPSTGNPIVEADLTLTFQVMKLAMFMPENARFLGQVRVLDIGLHPGFLAGTDTVFEWVQKEDVCNLVRPREKFAHKGQFGNALLIAGSREMMGAAILAAKACLRTGVGKLYCRIPASGLLALQTSLPEAICLPDTDEGSISQLPDLSGYQAIGVGPGLGLSPQTAHMVRDLLLDAKQPMVIDADALNIIGEQHLQMTLAKNKVLTPHVGEFHRIFDAERTGFARIRAAMEFSTRCGICIIIKGHYSFLSTPGGRGYFNSTGNPGMAKGGSGDILTGIILGLLAQKYSVDEASRLGMYVHGLAGDLARDRYGEQAVLASDIIDEIGKAFDAILHI